MRIVGLTAAFAIMIGSNCFAQLLQASGRLDVRTGAVRKTIERQWESGYGSYERDYERQTDLDVTVTTIGRIAYKARLEWFFIGKSVTGKNRHILSRDSQAIEVKPTSPAKYTIESNPVAARDNKYVYLGMRNTSGSKIEGWVVRLLTDDGKVLDERASATYLTDWLKKELVK